MQYPNAYNGVKKIYTAQILALVALFLMLIGLIGLIAALPSGDEVPDEVSGSLVLFAGLILISGIIDIVAFIINIVGLNSAKKDEEIFKKAVTWTIVAIVIAVVSSFMETGSMTGDLFRVVSDLANLLITIYIIQGIVSLASRLNNQDIAEKGNKAIKIVLFVTIASAVLDAISAFISEQESLTVADSVISIIAIALQIFVTVVYLKLLSGATKMLAQPESAVSAVEA